MKKRRKGRSTPLFSDIDLYIFQKLLEDGETHKTHFNCCSYQYIKNRLHHWKNKGLIEFNHLGKGKVKICKGKHKIIKSQFEFFKDQLPMEDI